MAEGSQEGIGLSKGNEMKPSIGRIVIIHQPSGEQIAGIITQVHTDECVNISGFIPNGNVSGFCSLAKRNCEPVTSTCWDWPERV